jgi:hypothetical protein
MLATDIETRWLKSYECVVYGSEKHHALGYVVGVKK